MYLSWEERGWRGDQGKGENWFSHPREISLSESRWLKEKKGPDANYGKHVSDSLFTGWPKGLICVPK